MADASRFKLILTGPYKGHTGVLRGQKFENGVLTVKGTLDNIKGLVNYYSKTYRAYLEGSEELKIAQEADRLREETNGKRDDKREIQPETGGEQADSGVRPDGVESTEETADEREPDGDSGSGGEGGVPGGDGYENAGVRSEGSENGYEPVSTELEDSNSRIKNAVFSLDPYNDEHWTTLGLPAMAAVEEFYGSSDITRRQVEAAIPDWGRDKAKEVSNI